MTPYILDTNTLLLFEQGHLKLVQLIRPPLTVDGLGITRAEGLARLREAIERRMVEGESVAQTFQSDVTGSTNLTN